MFKDNNKDTRTTPVAFHIETSHMTCNANQITDFYMKCIRRCSGVFIVNVEHISHRVLVFFLLTLSRKMPDGKLVSKL